MALVAPAPSRVQLQREPGRLRAVVPVRRNWPAILFLGAWLGGWAFGETFAIRQVFFTSTPLTAQGFLLFWLAGWTVGGAFAFYTLAWSTVGREEIVVDGRVLAIRQAAGPIGRTRRYDLAQVQELRAASTEQALANRFGRFSYPGMNRGELAFSYGAKTYRLGIGLEGLDVKLLLEALRERIPDAQPAF